MAANNEDVISSFIDLESVKNESQQFLGILANIYDSYQKVANTKISFSGATGSGGAASGAKQLKTDIDALTAAQNKLTQSQTETAQKLAVVKEQQLQVSKANKDAARETLGLTDAYAKLAKQYDEASRSAKNLAVAADQVKQQFGATSPEFLKASEDAEKAANSANNLGNRLKQIDASVGQFQRNVGNYTGAISILEKSLNDVRSSIDQFNKSGNQNVEVLDKLTREETLLEQILGQNAGGFASLSQEIRNNERALQTMQEQGFKGSEAFEQLRIATADARREVNEFKKSQELLSSEVPAIAALTSAARGLGAAYAVGAGTTALFGDGNEKLEKELNKLVAVMTLLQGLTELNAALKEKDAIATAFQTGWAKIATIAQNAWNATLLEGVVATTAFRIALVGITGGLFLLLPILALGATKIDNIDHSLKKLPNTSKAVKDSLKEMGNTALDIAENVIKKLDESINSLNDELHITPTTIDQANAALDLLGNQASETEAKMSSFWESFKIGATQGFLAARYTVGGLAENFSKQLDILNKLREIKEKEFMKKQGDDLNNAFNANLENTKNEAQLNIDKNQRILSDDKATQSQKISALRDNLAQQKEIIRADLFKDLAGTSDTNIRAQKQKEANNKIIIAQRDFNTQMGKLNEDFTIKALGDSYALQKAYLEQFADFFKSDAENEKNSYDARLTSLALYYQQKQKLIQLDLDKELNDPKASKEAKLAAEVDAQTQLFSLKKQYAAESTALLQDETNKETAIAIAALNKQLQAEKDAQQAKQDLEKDTLDSITNGSNFTASVQAKNYVDQERALIDSYGKRLISQQQYQEQSAQLSAKYAAQQFTQQVDALNKLIAAAGDDIDKREEFEKNLADIKEKFDQQVTDKKIDNLNKVHDLEKQLAEQSIALLQAVVDGGYDNQKNAIQDQINLLEDKKQKDIQVADATITNAQDKAAAITVINAKADAQETQLKQKQKDLDIKKAKFDKAVQVAQIVANIAQGEAALFVKAAQAKAEAAVLLANPLTAAYAPVALASAGLIVTQEVLLAALGAAQIAAVLATPVPTYAHGTDDHIGGAAIVGDGGRREIALMPDGRIGITPDSPTLVDLPKHTTVFPDADQFLKVAYNMMNPDVPVFDRSLVDSRAYMEEMTSTLRKELRDVKNTIANKKETHFHVTPFGLLSQQRDLNNQIDYLNDNLHF
jgi:hypothetical protein